MTDQEIATLFSDLHRSLLRSSAHDVIGTNGVEPKLKLKIAPLDRVNSDAVSLDTMLDRIILGPSVSSPLALNSYGRMLELIGKKSFGARVRASTIPLQPA